MEKTDWILITWMVTSFALDVAILSATTYLVFWRGASGLWFVFAVLLLAANSPTLVKVLKKRYGVAEDALTNQD